MSEKFATPKKSVKRGRKPNENSASDYCRLCNCSLKVKFGNSEKFSYVSTECLFEKSETKSKSQECVSSRAIPLAELCVESIGSGLRVSSQFSTRVCKGCGRKIRNAYALIKLIRSEINKPNTRFIEREDNVADNRYKRQLPTSIDKIDRSPQVRKEIKNDADSALILTATFPRAKKSLSLLDKKCCQKHPESSRGLLESDRLLSALNVEELLDKNSENTKVKVVTINSDGRVDTRSSFSKDTKSLLINVSRRKWKAVANIVLKHKELREEMVETMGRRVAAEFKEFCGQKSDSVLTRRTPSEIASISNKVIVHEVQLNCPFWYSCLKGACNAESKLGSRSVKIVNSMALATATAARCRNQKISAVAYRISTILFHSGVRSRDLNRLNKLGICMSPDTIVNFQKRMGENCESKVSFWKKEIERNMCCKLLLEEVKKKQIGLLEDDDMEVDVTIDFSQETVKNYAGYDANVFKTCETLLDNLKISGDVLTDEHLMLAINTLKKTRLPVYK